jgi:hypothetical protein
MFLDHAKGFKDPQRVEERRSMLKTAVTVQLVWVPQITAVQVHRTMIHRKRLECTRSVWMERDLRLWRFRTMRSFGSFSGCCLAVTRNIGDPQYFSRPVITEVKFLARAEVLPIEQMGVNQVLK